MNTEPTLKLSESHMHNGGRKDIRRVCLIMNQKKALKIIRTHNVRRYICIIQIYVYEDEYRNIIPMRHHVI